MDHTKNTLAGCCYIRRAKNVSAARATAHPDVGAPATNATAGPERHPRPRSRRDGFQRRHSSDHVGSVDSHDRRARRAPDRRGHPRGPCARSAPIPSEAVILVAHGPVADAENEKWLEKKRVLAAGVQRSALYASVDCLTVRDDAPAAIKAAATAELRALVTKHRDAGSRVLIVPVLLSYGGIEQGIKKRLAGLEYAFAAKALMPDDRLELWVKQQAGS